jgi:hypothetical protein
MLMQTLIALIAQTVAAGGGQTFDTVALDGGGEVIVRRGREARAVLREGERAYTDLDVANGRLTVRRCARHCPRGYRMVVEVTMPALAAASVSNGGRIVVQAGLAAPAPMTARVEQGGAIDLRALRIAALDASVFSGGRIFASVENSLDASVQQGGQILYWGRPRVRHSISQGGVVAPGRDGDLDRPPEDLHPRLPPPAPMPPVPPVPHLW